MSDANKLSDGGDRVMVFIATDAFSDEKHVLMVNMNTMKLAPPGVVDKGTYRTNGGIHYKVDGGGSVIDDTEAWNRGYNL